MKNLIFVQWDPLIRIHIGLSVRDHAGKEVNVCIQREEPVCAEKVLVSWQDLECDERDLLVVARPPVRELLFDHKGQAGKVVHSNSHVEHFVLEAQLHIR